MKYSFKSSNLLNTLYCQVSLLFPFKKFFFVTKCKIYIYIYFSLFVISWVKKDLRGLNVTVDSSLIKGIPGFRPTPKENAKIRKDWAGSSSAYSLFQSLR